MHILFFTENFPPEMNAAATRVYERACYWVKWEHRVTVITCAPNFPQGKVHDGYKNKWYQREEMDGIQVIRVKTFISANSGFMLRVLDFLSFMVTGFCAGLVAERPDIIVSTSPQFFTAVAGWMVAKLRRLPFIFELGDLWPASISAVGAMKQNFFLRMMEKFELFLYRQSAAVVALTKAFKADLISRNIPANKICVVRNGVDLPRYKPMPKDIELLKEWSLEGKFVFGYIGTHGMAHGLENVLAAAEILKDNDQIRFVFVGAGAMRDSLIEEVKEKGLRNALFIPAQPKEKMPAFWSICDVALIHLKDLDVFKTVIPSKMFEAMGMGIPLMLVSPEGEASEIVLQDGAGPWVPAGNPEQLAEECKKLIEDPELLEKYKTQSYASAPLHSREKQATEMIEALEKVLAGKPQTEEV